MKRPAILYVTRRTPAPDTALDQAVRLASSSGAELTVLHAHRGPGPTPGATLPTALNRLSARARREGVSVRVHVVGHGRPWAEEMAALDWDRYEIVLKVAEPEHGVARRLGRTVDQRLARVPRVPVWFVPASRGAEVRVVLAAVDVGRADTEGLSAAVVRTGAALASAEKARLCLVHAWSLMGESILACPVRGVGRTRVRRVVATLRKDRRDRLDELADLGRREVPTNPVVVRGLPGPTVRRVARELGADLLVLGTLRRSGLEGALVGNLAERFPGRDGLGVLVVKPGSPTPSFGGRAVQA